MDEGRLVSNSDLAAFKYPFTLHPSEQCLLPVPASHIALFVVITTRPAFSFEYQTVSGRNIALAGINFRLCICLSLCDNIILSIRRHCHDEYLIIFFDFYQISDTFSIIQTSSKIQDDLCFHYAPLSSSLLDALAGNRTVGLPSFNEGS